MMFGAAVGAAAGVWLAITDAPGRGMWRRAANLAVTVAFTALVGSWIGLGLETVA
jgi:hypothetical protein